MSLVILIFWIRFILNPSIKSRDKVKKNKITFNGLVVSGSLTILAEAMISIQDFRFDFLLSVFVAGELFEDILN